MRVRMKDFTGKYHDVYLCNTDVNRLVESIQFHREDGLTWKEVAGIAGTSVATAKKLFALPKLDARPDQ